MTTERVQLHKLCGLKELPANGTAWHEQIMAGLPFRGVHLTATTLGVTDKELAELLKIDLASFETKDAPLPLEASNLLYRIALAITRLMVKMSDMDKATSWLRNTQPLLRNYVPILFLQSQIGADYVYAAIDRMISPKDLLISQEEAPDVGTVEFEHNIVDGEEPDPDD